MESIEITHRDTLSALEDRVYSISLNLDAASKEIELLQENKDVEFLNELQSLKYFLTASRAIAGNIRNKAQNVFENLRD